MGDGFARAGVVFIRSEEDDTMWRPRDVENFTVYDDPRSQWAKGGSLPVETD